MKHLVLLTIDAACAAQAPRPAGPYATFQTSEGTIVARLFEKETPDTVRSFVGLAQGTTPWYDTTTRKFVKRPFYHDMVFHRVVPATRSRPGTRPASATRPAASSCAT